MNNAQRLGVALFYAATAALGAAYAIFEQHQANLLGHAIKEVMPALFILIVAFVVFALFRTVVSVLRRLNGVSRAAHATLYADYGKKKLR
jgi:hypothetical protein